MFNNKKQILAYFEVRLAALILKNVAFDSAATAFAWNKKKEKH